MFGMYKIIHRTHIQCTVCSLCLSKAVKNRAGLTEAMRQEALRWEKARSEKPKCPHAQNQSYRHQFYTINSKINLRTQLK